MFDVILQELIQSVPGARGAVFCDGLGESVNAIGASGRKAPGRSDDYDLRVAGAQFATPFDLAAQHNQFLRHISEATISGPKERLLIQQLQDGYYIVLALEPTALVGLGWHRLRIAASRVLAEM